MSKVYIEGIGTQADDIHQELTSKVEALQPKDIGKDGLVRIVVKGLIYVGRLFLAGRLRRFQVERCEKVQRKSASEHDSTSEVLGIAESNQDESATDASAAPVKRAPRKSATKKSASKHSKRAKRSSK